MYDTKKGIDAIVAYDSDTLNDSCSKSPDGTTKLWQPVVGKEYMHVEEAAYESLEHAIAMNRKYAEEVWRQSLNKNMWFATGMGR
uniref:Uncharacterized protein n=1 Tax=Lactuca sativa TaxID=4236 RepID=A0A9R1V2U0_LACSA|nr:hypothetical protein LSAT_V11C700362110 [Lactuca sativa]